MRTQYDDDGKPTTKKAKEPKRYKYRSIKTMLKGTGADYVDLFSLASNSFSQNYKLENFKASQEESTSITEQLAEMLGFKCNAETKQALRRKLTGNLKALPTFAQHAMSVDNNIRLTYAAGQSYGHEITAIRKHILKGY